MRDNFKVNEVPVLAKILTLASLQGIADLLTGEGIRFNEFEMKFNKVKGLMTICELIDIYHRFGNNKWCEEIFNKNGNMAIDDLWKKYENTLNTQHTAPSTREWFKQNKPDEDDWLKPLNFNYR